MIWPDTGYRIFGLQLGRIAEYSAAGYLPDICFFSFPYSNLTDVKQASWKDVVQLYEHDSKYDLRLAPKLTEAHVRPNNFQRMKVKYATQVLSYTVSASLLTYASSGHGSGTMIGTVELFEFLDSLFNVFNSSSRRNSNTTKKAFQQNDMQLQFLRKATKILRSIKVFDSAGKDVTSQFSFIKGWLLNISSLKSLWQHLQSCQFEFLLTRHLNQDCLEQFFGEVRSSSGNNRRVTPWQFSSIFPNLWGLQYLKIVQTGNCEHVQAEQLNAIRNQRLVKETNWLQAKLTEEPRNTFTVNLAEVVSVTNFLKENSFVYVCGWLFRKCYDSHKCNLVLPILANADPSLSLIFTTFKQFENCNLLAPPSEFVEYIREIEDQFCILFYDCCYVKGVANHLSNIIRPNSQYICCENLREHYLLHYFIRIRIYFILKFWNRNLSDPSFRNKMLTVAHL